MQPEKSRYQSFTEFYPYYLREHKNRTCRRLHFAGTTLVLGLFGYGLVNADYFVFWYIPVAGYGFAWAGHFFFEKNRPATFTHPFYSLLGDFVMYSDILTGKIKF
jgi:hypothetical protein